MKEELVEQLHRDHPDLCEKASDGEFSVGDGWYNIIDVLCSQLSRTVNHYRLMIKYKIKKSEDVRELEDKLKKAIEELPIISQVKEKFGGLRFYIDGGTEEQLVMIDFAEAMSLKTCETCGDRGRSRGGGWIKVLCDKHADEREAENPIAAERNLRTRFAHRLHEESDEG